MSGLFELVLLLSPTERMVDLHSEMVRATIQYKYAADDFKYGFRNRVVIIINNGIDDLDKADELLGVPLKLVGQLCT